MYYKYPEKIKKHKLYYLGKYTAKALSYPVYRKVTVKGRENIPSDGPLIIACNHIAFSDPAVIVANCPRTVHFMAKSELFENPFKAAFMKNMNAFPVRRNTADRNALRHAKKVIESGHILGIFPEGKRIKNSPPTEGKTGVAYLALLTRADVMPVCIYRNEKDTSLWHSLNLSFGKVIKNSELGFNGGNRNEELTFASEYIMKKIKELWETENENYGC